MVTVQWFYRPEKAKKQSGSYFRAHDTRELFYSFHLEEVSAESVIHTCVVHFVPPHKQLPFRAEHPGFIVQKVYDVVEKKTGKITGRDYEDAKQEEINLLIEKSRQRLGELPNKDDCLGNRQNLGKESVLPTDAFRGEKTTPRSSSSLKSKDVSEFHSTLEKFQVSTGDDYRDKWVAKLLKGIQLTCHSMDGASTVDRGQPIGSAFIVDDVAGAINASKKVTSNASEPVVWPDDAVPTVAALEKAAHEALCSSFQKYNQKMRQLDFNLKSNGLLARRVLKKELEPSVVVNMSPAELKDGYTDDEKRSLEPEQLPPHAE